MAESPSHRFGQIIGELVELALLPKLEGFAQQHGLCLDKHGLQPNRTGKRCTWADKFGNKHGLDYVLYRLIAPDIPLRSVAFIETAWRRYTKHSRNKAQEIQGALLPLYESYREFGPFLGVVLAGVFTEGALTQLRSLGFQILFFPYQSVIGAFRKFGIDADFDERTADTAFKRKVRAYRALSPVKKHELALRLFDSRRADVDCFMTALESRVCRRIERIVVLPLHGRSVELSSVEAAINFIDHYTQVASSLPVQTYEIQIRFSNGDRIDGRFGEKKRALAYLTSLRTT